MLNLSTTSKLCVLAAAHGVVVHAPTLPVLNPYRVADTAVASPPTSPVRDSETPEADSAPLPSASSPSAPGSSDSPAGSRDCAAAAGEAQIRAAVAAEAAAEAAAENGSSGEDAAAAAGAAPAAQRQAADQQREPVQRLARTSSDKVSAEAVADGSAQLSGEVNVLTLAGACTTQASFTSDECDCMPTGCLCL